MCCWKIGGKIFVVVQNLNRKTGISRKIGICEKIIQSCNIGIDVWRGIWRCTHAKLAPLTPHSLARDRHYGLASRERGERFGAGNFSAPISPLLPSMRMVRLHSPFVLGSIRISGLDGKLTAGCLRSGPAWIVFCFRCWVADGKNRGGGWRGPALGAGWWWLWATPTAPALSPFCGALSERQKRPPGPILLRFSA